MPLIPLDRHRLIVELEELVDSLDYLTGVVEQICDTLPTHAIEENRRHIERQRSHPLLSTREGRLDIVSTPIPLYESALQYFSDQFDRHWMLVRAKKQSLMELLRWGDLRYLDCDDAERAELMLVATTLTSLPEKPPDLDFSRPFHEVVVEWNSRSGFPLTYVLTRQLELLMTFPRFIDASKRWMEECLGKSLDEQSPVDQKEHRRAGSLASHVPRAKLLSIEYARVNNLLPRPYKGSQVEQRLGFIMKWPMTEDTPPVPRGEWGEVARAYATEIDSPGTDMLPEKSTINKDSMRQCWTDYLKRCGYDVRARN